MYVAGKTDKLNIVLSLYHCGYVGTQIEIPNIRILIK